MGTGTLLPYVANTGKGETGATPSGLNWQMLRLVTSWQGPKRLKTARTQTWAAQVKNQKLSPARGASWGGAAGMEHREGTAAGTHGLYATSLSPQNCARLAYPSPR